MAVLLTPPYLQFFDDNGDPLVGGKVYTYVAGTTTPKATYTDSTETTQAANPIILDSAGRTTIWISGSYTIKVTDALGNLIKNTDNITAFNTASTSINSLLPSQTGNAGKALTTDGTNVAWGFAGTPVASLKDKVLNGLVVTNNATDATNDIDVSAGSCVSDDGTTVMTLGTSYTKQLDAAWSVGTSTGGRDAGSISDATWYVWIINRTDTDVTDVLLSLSATSPTMPSNYTKKKKIGYFVRSSSAILTGVGNFNDTVLSGPVYSASGVDITIDLTPIADRKKIYLLLSGLSNTNNVNNNTGDLVMRIGPAAGIETAGYISYAGFPTISGGSRTDGFVWAAATGTGGLAARTFDGRLELALFNSNRWVFSAQVNIDVSSGTASGGKTLANAITQLTLRCVDAVSTWDAGSVRIFAQ